LVTAPGTTLQLISPAAADLSVSVSSRNTNPLYDRRAVRPLARRLLEMGGAYQGFYSPDDIQAQEAALLSTPSNTPTDHVR
jgi:hypothetical protein